MKKIILLFIVLNFLSFDHSYGQCIIPIKNSSSVLLGYVTEGEYFYNLSSTKVLDFSTDGEIKDFDNSTIATYDRETGEVRDQNSDLMMTVMANGTVKDAQNTVIGSVDAYGVLRDHDNYLLATITGIDKICIAYYFFFYANS